MSRWLVVVASVVATTSEVVANETRKEVARDEVAVMLELRLSLPPGDEVVVSFADSDDLPGLAASVVREHAARFATLSGGGCDAEERAIPREALLACHVGRVLRELRSEVAARSTRVVDYVEFRTARRGGPRALVATFTFGLRYEALFAWYFRASVLRYCERHGHDFRQYLQPLDGFRSAGTRAQGLLAQKLLVATRPFSEGYDAVVWVDGDVYVADHAPDVVAACPDTGVVCGTNQNAQVNARLRLYAQVTRGLEQRGATWYADRGIAFEEDDVLQSGVLVFRPKHHGALCREIYEAIIADDHYRRHGEDQPFFSYEFLRRGLVHFLRWEFNAVWQIHHHFVALRPDDDDDKVEILARLLFVANFVHFTSMADVHLLPEAARRAADVAAKIDPRPDRNRNRTGSSCIRVATAASEPPLVLACGDRASADDEPTRPPPRPLPG